MTDPSDNGSGPLTAVPSEMLEEAYRGGDRSPELIQEMNTRPELSGLVEDDPTGRIRRVTSDLLRDLRNRQDQKPEAVPTFLPSWNTLCGGPGGQEGIARGWNCLIAGPTGAGKSLLVLNQIAKALTAGYDTLLFSLEMSWEINVTRLRGIISENQIRKVEWGQQFDRRAAEEADRIITGADGDLFINTEPIWRLGDIREIIGTYQEHEGIQHVVVDYVQLAEPDGDEDKMAAKLGTVANELRDAAERYRVACLGVSQTSQGGMYGSRQLEHAAHQILVIDEDSIEERDGGRIKNMTLEVQKNRHGPEGPIEIQLDTDTLKFTELDGRRDPREGYYP